MLLLFFFWQVLRYVCFNKIVILSKMSSGSLFWIHLKCFRRLIVLFFFSLCCFFFVFSHFCSHFSLSSVYALRLMYVRTGDILRICCSRAHYYVTPLWQLMIFPSKRRVEIIRWNVLNFIAYLSASTPTWQKYSYQNETATMRAETAAARWRQRQQRWQ